jgi:voltage-gated potassium channel
MNNGGENELRRAAYEIFILTLTLLSLFNLGLIIFANNEDIVQVAYQINLLLSLLFFLDFLFRLRTADVKREYLIKQYGWLDFLGSLPITGASLARLMRLFRATNALRKIGRQVAANRADTALIVIGICVVFLLEFGAIFVLQAESSAVDAEITTADDALWWVLVTISTVGYGDYYPVTEAGRFVAIFVIVAGVGVFGTLSGYLTNSFLGQKEEVDDEEGLSNKEELLVEIKQLQQEQVNLRREQEEAKFVLLARLDTLEKLLHK